MLPNPLKTIKQTIDAVATRRTCEKEHQEMNDNCHVDPIEKNATSEERKTVKRLVLAVRGMGCPNCATRVHNSLVALTGVINAYVDHITGTAEVEFNPQMVAIPALVSAVAKAGNDGRHDYSAVPVIE
jgi:copper chaperone CopZ